MKFKVGERVKGPHGLGTVVGMNSSQPMSYLQEKPSDAIAIAEGAGLTRALVNGFYSADRYPYVVKFDTGYQDVYCDSSLEKVK